MKKLTSIYDLEMTTRLFNVLKHNNIEHLEDLQSIYSHEMKDWHNCGYSTIKEASALLAQNGLTFKDKPIFNTPDDFKVTQNNIDFLRFLADILEEQRIEIAELRKKLETYKHSDHLQETVDNLRQQLHRLREGYYKYRGGKQVYTKERNKKIYEDIEAGEIQQVVGDKYGLTKSAVCHIYRQEKEKRGKFS